MPPLGKFAMLMSTLMLVASTSYAAALTYKSSCTGSSNVPPVSTKATGSVTVILYNTSYATGYFYASNIKQLTMAHIHAGAVGKNGPVIIWAFNATYGPISGSIKASFTYNPSVNNVSALLAAGLAYLNIHTTANPAGELRGQLIGPSNVSYPAPPSPPEGSDDGYGGTSTHAAIEYHPLPRLPMGSYFSSCEDCSYVLSTTADVLTCMCPDPSGAGMVKSTLETNTCPSYLFTVLYVNGKLVCGPP